jgi:peptidoglycan hydrolase-like protein with peptidoglycan-binding domain
MAIQKNDTGLLVKKWQMFLKLQGFFAGESNGNFGPKTEEATKAFQRFHTITPASGIAGSITLGKAFELGFNPENAPVPFSINSDIKLMLWIKDNLGSIIQQAATNSFYGADWLAGMCARETGFLITRYVNQQKSFFEICGLMKGDFGKRKNDTQKKFHGFGFWQIDIDSFSDFVNTGKWTDPLETARMAVTVLNQKKDFLVNKGWQQQLNTVMFERAVTAAYNCGQGNVDKALRIGKDVDHFTFSKDYSKEVFRYRNIYQNL